jgi:hypothetical protein
VIYIVVNTHMYMLQNIIFLYIQLYDNFNQLTEPPLLHR